MVTDWKHNKGRRHSDGEFRYPDNKDENNNEEKIMVRTIHSTIYEKNVNPLIAFQANFQL